MEIAGEIRGIAEKHLQDASHFIVDVLVLFRKNPKKLLVILDGDNGVTIDDCARLSRELSAELDSSGIINEPFVMEVSTPGLDHPLTLRRQYVKNKGRKLKVKSKDTTVEGLLTDVTDDSITLQQETGKGKHREMKSMMIPFSAIEKTFVLVSFK
jgi:ribosome maturation factor RimP